MPRFPMATECREVEPEATARMGKRGRMTTDAARNRAWDCGIIQVMNRYRRLWRLSKERSSNRGPAGATVSGRLAHWLSLFWQSP